MMDNITRRVAKHSSYA